MSKRLKTAERTMSSENNSFQTQSTVANNSSQTTIVTSYNPYHESVCGSILLPLPSKLPSDVFTYLRHGRFEKFRQCLDAYHKEIIQMRNEYEQTVLHILSIYAYPYQWVRLLLMYRCNPCDQDKDGCTAAHYAVERDDVEMLKALTTRFYPGIKIFSEEQINHIHENCLKALTIRDQNGLTVFMLACQYQSLKCLDYLIELKINDVNLQDNFGDTCLHFAVARRNKILVEKLIHECQANVNSGLITRPSVLDVLQFNREQQKTFDRTIDDAIEQILLSHNASNRCQIQRVINKRKHSDSNDETAIANLACLTVGSLANSQLHTAKNYARVALSAENNGDLTKAQECYQCAMDAIPNNSLDWIEYASCLAIIYMTRGENSLALNLFEQALSIRKELEKESEEMNKLQEIINRLRDILK